MDTGHHKAADLKDDLGTPGREIWRKKCGQQVSDTAGGRWSRQHRTELDGEEWSVAYAPLGAKRLKSSKSSHYRSFRLRWYGHVLRKEDTNWVKKCMECEVEGSRPRGRPKRTRKEVVQKDCQARNLNKGMLWIVLDGRS